MTKKGVWDLLLAFSMAAAQMDPNNRKISVLAMEVEPVLVIDPKLWKWTDQILDATLVTRPTRSIVMRKSVTSQIYQSFWGNLTRVMGSGMGKMLQAQHSQHQLLSPLVYKRDAGNYTAIGHWQRSWDMPRSTQKLASQ